MIDRPSEAMLTLTLPDGSQRTVASGTLPSEVVKSIGERLLQAAVAVEVNDTLQDLVTPLRVSGTFRVLTDRDAPALDVLRHSAAHILATAVRRLRPDAKIGFGPSIDEGFYYDFEVAQPFTPEDLASFENEMRKVAAEKLPFVRKEVSRSEAQQRFADDPLKLERLSELGDHEIISTYTDGPFIDLCRGPHVPDTSRLKHFKLTAYRRRLLAGRFQAPDAAAHLRDGVLQEGRARRVPPAYRGSAEARPPRGRPTARPVHDPPVRARRRVLDGAWHHRCSTRFRISSASASATTSARSRRRSCTTRGCGRSPATGASTARTCSSCSTTRRASTSSRSSP